MRISPALSYMILSEEAGSLEGHYKSTNFIIKPAAGITVRELPSRLKFVYSLGVINLDINQTYILKTIFTSPLGETKEGLIEIPELDASHIAFSIPTEIETDSEGVHTFETYLNDVFMGKISIFISLRR